MEEKRLEMLKQLAAGIAAQFGSNCEVVIHDVSSNHPDHSCLLYTSLCLVLAVWILKYRGQKEFGKETGVLFI